MKSPASRVLLGLLAVLAFAAGPVQAQGKKKKAAPAKAAAKAEAPREAARRVEGEADKDANRKGPAKLEAKQAPPKLEDVQRESIADKKRDESIESLKKIIPKIEDGSPQKADLLFQLSEFYWEKSRFLYRKEMLKFFDDQKAVDVSRNSGKKADDAKQDHRESELYRSETMRLYETILREYPAYERKDEVLFNLAYNQYEIGKRDQAVKRYEELFKNYPGSRFVSDTYVQLGNHYFEVANVLAKAKFYYEKAYASTNPRIQSYALYKLAWCDFNAGEHEMALDKLKKTIEFAETKAKASSEKRVFTDLKNEALRDSIIMFVQLNRADDAIAYFKAHSGKKKQRTLIGRLAYALQDAGHHDNGIKSFRLLLDEEPLAAGAPDYQQAIIKSYEGLRQRENVKTEVKKLAKLYRPGSRWWTANESKKEVLRNGFSVAEEAMRTTVTEYHQEAQKTKQVETYRLARDIYKEYIDAFATSEDEAFVSDQAFNLKFYYAEILWALEEWEPAAKQYDQVVTFKVPSRPEAKEASNDKYRQTAAYTALLAYEKLVKIEEGKLAKSDLKEGQKVEETKKKGQIERQKKAVKRSVKELEEQKLTDYQKALVAACDRYNTLYPKNQDEVDVAYQAAVIFYERNHFVEAGRRFTDIILKYPAEKRSQEAADLTMAVLEEKEEWLELNTSARQFGGNKQLSKPGTEFAKRVATIIEGSQYKYIDDVVYKKEKNAKKAADMYVAFVAEFPKSDNADRALTYAMVIAQEANELDKAISLGERMLKEYPQTVFDLKAKYLLGYFYEKIANFDRSAAMYEEFVATYDLAAGDKAVGYAAIRDVLKRDAEALAKARKANKGKTPEGFLVVNTVELRKLPAEKKTARQELIKEADAWVADATYNVAFWNEGLGKFQKAIDWYNRYLTRFKDRSDVPEIAYNIGLVLEKDGKWAEAIKHYDSYLTNFAKDARVSDTRRLECRYRQFLAYRTLKDTASMERVAKDIAPLFAKLKDEEKKNDRAKLAAAHTRFFLLEPQWNAYLAQKFDYKVFDRKAIGTFSKTDRPRKEKALAEMEKAYTGVLTIGNPEYAIASLTRIGLGYSDFAANIGAIPDPRGFDEDQVGIFRGELENRYVFPVEEKSVEAFEKALAKSYELSIYNSFTLEAQDRLNKFKPGSYGKVRDVAYRGSEFFVTAGAERTVDLPAATAVTPPAPTAPAPQPPSAAAPTPGAGGR